MKNKSLYVETETVVDLSTGEVEKVITTTVKSVNKDLFIQVYLEDLSGIFNLETKVEIRLMAIIWRESLPNSEDSSEGNRIVIVKELKEIWAKEAETTLQTINNTLSKLTQRGLLSKKGRSVYYLNPKFFYKGSLKDRPKVIQNNLIYNIEYGKKEIQSDSEGGQ